MTNAAVLSLTSRRQWLNVYFNNACTKFVCTFFAQKKKPQVEVGGVVWNCPAYCRNVTFLKKK